MRRGWVQRMRAGRPAAQAASSRYWGTCVVLPQPVCPARTVTWWAAVVATICARKAAIGSAARCAAIATPAGEPQRDSRLACAARHSSALIRPAASPGSSRARRARAAAPSAAPSAPQASPPPPRAADSSSASLAGYCAKSVSSAPRLVAQSGKS